MPGGKMSLRQCPPIFTETGPSSLIAAAAGGGGAIGAIGEQPR